MRGGAIFEWKPLLRASTTREKRGVTPLHLLFDGRCIAAVRRSRPDMEKVDLPLAQHRPQPGQLVARRFLLHRLFGRKLHVLPHFRDEAGRLSLNLPALRADPEVLCDKVRAVPLTLNVGPQHDH